MVERGRRAPVAAPEPGGARPRRWWLWLFVVLWASDWMFAWTERLGLGELGFWVWLIGLIVLVYRSVVDTALPEWLLTWGWMLGVLGIWLVQITLISDFALDEGLVSGEAPWRGHADEFGASTVAELDAMVDLLAATLAVSMLGWGQGVLMVLIGGVCLTTAFSIRRRRLEASPRERGRAEPRPALSPAQHRAHRTLVALQFPVFALLVAGSLTLLSAGIALCWGGQRLSPPEAGVPITVGRTLTLVGLGGFLLGVLELRQLLCLRWCGRVRLVIAGLVAIVVLGAAIGLAVWGHPLWWIAVAVALVWCFAQTSAVRTLWPVRGRSGRD